MNRPEPLVLVNAVGLTSRLLEHAPRIRSIAAAGRQCSLVEVLPAVTCSVQASLLTGTEPTEHGIVGNGWLFRETGEVRFWQQSNLLLKAEPLYETARRHARERGMTFTCAKLFWWFNQGAKVDWSVTPKPYYGADGNKVFGISGKPEGFTENLEERLGPFPFHTFWGPRAGLASTEWIAKAAGEVIAAETPSLTLVYLPHLDYDPQRFGPSGSDMPRLTGELDAACEPILDAAKKAGARVWFVSEYGHCDVSRPVYLNRALRKAGLLAVRPGPFGETLDLFESSAQAVCDHQLAHVYVKEPDDIARVRDLLLAEEGVASVHVGEARAELGLDHERSGEIVALAERDAWFAYPYWLEESGAPDFARTVDIHRKPGYDPCELFVDPKLAFPQVRVAAKLLRKKLGFRMLMDLIPLDAGLVRGSHGLRAADPLDRPVLIGDARMAAAESLAASEVAEVVFRALFETAG